MFQFVAEWKQLRREIRQAPQLAHQLDNELTDALYRYRMHLTKLSNKPHRLDRQIWDGYDETLTKLKPLLRRSRGRLLRTSASLRQLREEWAKLHQQQRDLLALIDQTMERSEFYNKMEEAKDRKSRQRAQRAEVEGELSAARRGLIRAIHYALLRERAGESLTAGSLVLDIDAAIDHWQRELEAVLEVKTSSTTSHEEKLAQIESLRRRIIDAPGWAENIRHVEEQFDHLLQLEDQLYRITGRGQLSQLEVDDMLQLLRVEAAQYWAESDWDALEDIIDRVQTFVQRETGPLQSQLYVHRKKSGNWQGTSPTAQDDSSEAKESTDSSDPDQSGLHDGSLARALREQAPGTRFSRVNVDPDADDSVRRVFEGAAKDQRRSKR